MTKRDCARRLSATGVPLSQFDLDPINAAVSILELVGQIFHAILPVIRRQRSILLSQYFCRTNIDLGQVVAVAGIFGHIFKLQHRIQIVDRPPWCLDLPTRRALG